jgi:mannosyltransferase OCH1-like enzyme
MNNFIYKISKEYLEKKIELKNKLKIPYPLKSIYNIVIPTNIFQTWHSKNLPPLMSKSVQKIISLNPRFKYYIYDDNDCREFIKNYFKPDVLNAYNSLIPGAYRADLWRYCILFIYGGIYLDIKYKPLNGFKFINLTESEHFTKDINNIDIYNALMVCSPHNQILYKAIRQIVDNVNNKFYGNNALEPTGPALLSKFISSNDRLVDLKHDELNGDYDNKIIYFNDIPILKSYDGHINESKIHSKKKHYSVLWNERNIYY